MRLPVQLKRLACVSCAVALSGFLQPLLAGNGHRYDVRSLELDYDVAGEHPHPADFPVQGIVIQDGRIWESGGECGTSVLYVRNLETGRTLQTSRLADDYCARGLAYLNKKLFLLTWKAGRALQYNAETLALEEEHSYQGQGWGLTTDGRHLILSDGSSRLLFMDPDSFDVVRSLQVTLAGRAIHQLNKLEWVEGHILATVYQTDLLVAIDPEDGKIRGRVYLNDLRSGLPRGAHVLNGIAYDDQGQHLYLTGRYWPTLFEIAVPGLGSLKP